MAATSTTFIHMGRRDAMSTTDEATPVEPTPPGPPPPPPPPRQDDTANLLLLLLS